MLGMEKGLILDDRFNVAFLLIDPMLFNAFHLAIHGQAFCLLNVGEEQLVSWLPPPPCAHVYAHTHTHPSSSSPFPGSPLSFHMLEVSHSLTLIPKPVFINCEKLSWVYECNMAQTATTGGGSFEI